MTTRYRTPEELEWADLVGQDLHIAMIGTMVIGVKVDRSVVVLAQYIKPRPPRRSAELTGGEPLAMPASTLMATAKANGQPSNDGLPDAETLMARETLEE